ncbi:MAG: ferritin [Acidimicrobiia bacterium]
MTSELQDAYNDQITLEFASSYAYLQMAAFFEDANLPGFANWMRQQAEEERLHAMKFFDFVLDRGNHVELRVILAPSSDYTSPLSVFEASLAQEQKVTAAIHALYGQATASKDYESLPLLHWFINEQIEEESTVSELIDQIAMAGDNGAALLLLDRELGTRAPGAE